MKWSFSLPLLAASSVFAHSSDIVAARQAKVLAARQAHVERGLLDICISINGHLELLDILPGGKPLVFGDLDTCLCLGALPTFVKAFLSVKGGIAGIGELKLVSALSAYILSHPGKQSCDFPPHCKPKGNKGSLISRGASPCQDPCAFDCDDGYTAIGKKCVCLWPKKECNGQCGFFPQGCGASQAPKPWKRNTPLCSSGRELCGVAGGSQGKGWECVNIKRDLESCGGCVVPSPFGNEVSAGTDCSSIPHAAEVFCKEGSCHVSACAHGFVPSTSSDSCVPLAGVEKRDLSDENSIVARGGSKHLVDIDAFFKLFLSLRPLLTASLGTKVSGHVGKRGGKPHGHLFDIDAFFKAFAKLAPLFKASVSGGIDGHILKRSELEGVLAATLELKKLLEASLHGSVDGSLLARGGKPDLLSLEAFLKACLSLEGLLKGSIEGGVKGSVLKRGGKPSGHLLDLQALIKACLDIAGLLKASVKGGVSASVL